MIEYQEATPVSLADLEAFGWRIREFSGCTEDRWFPVSHFIEPGLQKLIGDNYSFEVHEIEDLGDRHGFAVPDDKLIALRLDVYHGVQENRGRDRMTAMHEVAHLFLHTKTTLSRRMSHAPPPPYRDPEWQAKCLAGIILVPARMVPQDFDALRVTREFGISMDAAEIRLKQIRRFNSQKQ